MAKLLIKVESATKLPKRNSTGTFTFIVKDTQAKLEKFAEIQGDALIEDEETGQFKWFSSTWFPYGNITLKEDYENIEGNPWELDLESLDPTSFKMAMMAQEFSTVQRPAPSRKSEETPSEDSDNADLEKPAPTKRVAKPNRRIGSK